jgi:hypothetical protein
MRQTTLEIENFNLINIRDETDDDLDYINLNLTLENSEMSFYHENSPFFRWIRYHILHLTQDNLKIKIRLRHNDKIDKDLEYIFMDIQTLSELTGTITPIQYKIRIIESLALFDD